jgi:hypothetical protein
MVLLLFRPWWDALEDFVIYGLILLGLIVREPIIILKWRSGTLNEY